VVLDVGKQLVIYKHFIICSGENERHVRALYDELFKACQASGIAVHHREDDGGESRWLVIDCFDVLVHIFTPESREFYNLEYLWRDAKNIKPGKRIKKTAK